VWRPTFIFYGFSLRSSYHKKCFKVVEKIKTHFLCSVTPPSKIMPLFYPYSSPPFPPPPLFYLLIFYFNISLYVIHSSTSGTEENRISELKSPTSSTLVTTTTTATTEKVEQQQQSVVVKTTTVISSTGSGTFSNETVSVNSTSHTPNSEFFPLLISCIFFAHCHIKVCTVLTAAIISVRK